MKFENFGKLIKKVQEICRIKKVYIWGTGVYGDLLGIYFNQHNIEWCGYYDNYTTNTVANLNGKKVYLGADVNNDSISVYVLSMRDYVSVEKQLTGIGIGEENIFSIDSIDVFSELDNNVYDNNGLKDEIKEFYHIHEGQSCFIVGNGPSLNKEDLNMIYDSHMISFGCNLIYRGFDETRWRPDYYVITDVSGITMVSKDVSYITNNCRYLFSRSNGRLRSYHDYIPNVRLFKYNYSDSQKNFEFSLDCSEQIYIGYTVTYAMLQLAVYMGFRTIYLIGIDHQYAKEIVNGQEVINNVKNHSNLCVNHIDDDCYLIDKVTLAYCSARKCADEHGVKIYNATRGGKLEVFERKKFDDIF